MGGRGGRLGAAGWHSGRGGGRESLPRHHGNRTALSKPQAVPVARCQGARVLQDSRNLLRPGTQQCAPSAAQPAPRRPRSPERPGHPHLALRASSRSRREPGGLGAPGRTCCPRRPHRQSQLLPGLSLWRPASLSVDPLISSHSCLHLYLVPPSPAASWTAFSFVPPSLPSRLKHTAPVDLAPPPLPSPSGAQHIYDKGDCPFLLVFFDTALIFSCCLLRCLSEPTFYPQPLKTSRSPLGTSAAFLVSFSRFVFCFSLSLREQ